MTDIYSEEESLKLREALDWIEHDGSGMPVPGDTLVYVQCNDGFDDSFCSHPTEASFWDGPFSELSSWLKSGDDDVYITSYRIVKS